MLTASSMTVSLHASLLACSGQCSFGFSLFTAWDIPMCGSHTIVVLEKCSFHYLDFSLRKVFLYYSYYVFRDNQFLEHNVEGSPKSLNSRAIFLFFTESYPVSFPVFPDHCSEYISRWRIVTHRTVSYNLLAQRVTALF